MNFLSYLPDFRRKTSFLGTIKGDKQHIYAVCRLFLVYRLSKTDNIAKRFVKLEIWEPATVQ